MAVVHDRPSNFVSFLRNQSYTDMLDPRPDESPDIWHYNIGSDMQHQFSDLAGTAYDAYPPTSHISNTVSNYYTAPDLVVAKSKGIQGMAQRQLPTSSTPSPSISQPFDHPPSILSSASGTSARSTTSSAVGSPYSQSASNVPSQEHWIDSQQGLGIAAGIANTEGYGHDIYPLNHLEHDLVLSSEKFSSRFVGESERFPSSASSFCSFPQSFISSTAVAPLLLDTNVGNQDLTIDTIINEARNRMDTPTSSISPASANRNHGSDFYKGTTPAPSPSQSNGSFKSPTTPASALSPLTPRTTSPSSTSNHRFHRPSLTNGHDPRIPGPARRASATSYRFYPYDRPVSHSKSNLYRDQSQSPFFGQSSGRFIAPLESSCWFSLLVLSPFSLLLFSFESLSTCASLGLLCTC